jgi:predicted O-linked N-acetylglucosamine transferase (SPINDLY family)
MKNVVQIFNQALSALQTREVKKAEKKFRQVIELDATNFPALNLLAICLMMQERWPEAEKYSRAALALNRKHDSALSNYALILKQLNRPADAYGIFSEALEVNSANPITWYNRGTVLSDQLGRYLDAISDFDRAVALERSFSDALCSKGKCLYLLNRHDEALAAYDKSLSINSNLENAWLGRGNVLATLRRADEALAAYDKSLSINSNLENAWLGRGNVLCDIERYDEALAAYDKALSIKPDLENAWAGRGNVLAKLKRYDEALAAYDKALSIRPDLGIAWLGRGNVFYCVGRYEEALAAYDRALLTESDLENAWLGRGNVFENLRRYGEAVAAYDKALSIKADLAEAWFGCGNVFQNLNRQEDAFAAYDKAFVLKPDLADLEGSRLTSKMSLCNWENLTDEVEHLTHSIRSGKSHCPPFAMLALSDSPEDHFLCARSWASTKYPQSDNPLWTGGRPTHEKIRIGYVSADFHEHATAYLMAEMFELHDKNRFEITAISLGPGGDSPMRQRLKRSFDRFLDHRDLPDLEIAKSIAESQIDILVDLKGYTRDARTNIFAHRPAPVQVNYLGYPGTMAAPYIDYIIGDKTVFGFSDQGDYTEKLVFLPHSYQPNDRQRPISEAELTREEFGLKRDQFVFCCFCNAYKISPDTFGSWMRILGRVEGSVLWLFVENESAKSNLKTAAASRGIDPERIIFAGKAELSKHLARHRLADLFLDTLPYNAHTTTSDALWAGLPVLTRIGKSFAGRVAASLLYAIQMPELVASSRDEYEALAVELALDRARLRNLANKLDKNRLTTPLFDAPLFTRHLEAAYEAMYRRYRAGDAPDHIEIAPIESGR